jgi:hypothetical protein
MMSRRHVLRSVLFAMAVAASLVSAGCTSPGVLNVLSGPSKAATVSSTRPAPPTTATTKKAAAKSPAATVPAVTVWYIQPASGIPPTWKFQYNAPYGAAVNRLGSAPGGDSGTLKIGPSYGARAANGTWYILDSAKKRITHLSATGVYLGAVAVPKSLLAQGIYFQYQLPRILADGTLIAESQIGSKSRILRVRGTSVTSVLTPKNVAIRADDGTKLYGFDQSNHMVTIDPKTGAVAATTWFRTQGGTRYKITAAAGKITIDLPDSRNVKHLVMPVKATTMPGLVHPSVEVGAGKNGVLFLFVSGFSETKESVQLVGYATVSRDGVPTAMERMRNPSSPADPGDPAHIGVAPGTSVPWLMFIDPAGLRTYLRS